MQNSYKTEGNFHAHWDLQNNIQYNNFQYKDYEIISTNFQTKWIFKIVFKYEITLDFTRQVEAFLKHSDATPP